MNIWFEVLLFSVGIGLPLIGILYLMTSITNEEQKSARLKKLKEESNNQKIQEWL